MPRYRPDPDKSRRLPPAKDTRSDEWHCEKCRTQARGRYCPRCEKCGEVMAYGDLGKAKP